MAKAKISTDIVLVTPEMAMDWLTKNTCNRPVREYWVTQLAGRMKRGEWRLNGETIKFSAAGIILDGQHRLMAVFESEVACEMLVARGLPDDAYETIDTGRPRTTGDYFAVRKEPHPKTIAGALRYLYYLQSTYSATGPVDWQGKVSNSQADNLLAAHPNIRQSIEHGMKARRLLMANLGIALHYLFAGIDDEKAALFFDSLATGADLKDDSPILQLRERLIERPKGYNMKPIMAAALTVKAWNAYYHGKALLNLRWRQTGPTPEPFPAIERPDAPKVSRNKRVPIQKAAHA